MSACQSLLLSTVVRQIGTQVRALEEGYGGSWGKYRDTGVELIELGKSLDDHPAAGTVGPKSWSVYSAIGRHPLSPCSKPSTWRWSVSAGKPWTTSAGGSAESWV